MVIARIWRGWTAEGDADAYVDYVRGTGMREYRETAGNRAAYLLRRTVGGRAEFVTLTLWDSLEAVAGFAGDDVERAVFYPEDDRYLVERDLTVSHYEVVDAGAGSVHELRVALAVEDLARALAFYRDALGLPVEHAWDEPTGSGAILAAGRGTLELISVDQAALIDRVEAGEGVGGPVRLAFEVDDSVAAADALVEAGGELLGGPVVTPWSHRNVRVRAPDGMQLTLFAVLGGDNQTVGE